MDRLANLLGALGIAITDDLASTVAAVSELPLTDAACLNVVAHADGCSIRYLSDTLAISHPGTVRLVDRMATAGHLTRGPGPDGRTIGVHLTAAGNRLWRRQRDARGTRLDEALASLTPKQRVDATSIVETLLNALTTDASHAERVCRFCNEAACPQQHCPVTCAAGG
jgi:MarR family transcriptional regulator, negative regulator of the multidrug operon emrRAB